MNKAEENIRKVFLMKNDTLLTFEEDEFLSFIGKNSFSYTIAIPFKTDKPIHEEFVGFEVETSFANFGNESIPVLALIAPLSINVENLITISTDFIKSENRDYILKNPYDWIDNWKSLFGDSLKKKMIFDVVGEMLTLDYFFDKDKSLKWVGQTKCTHDIVGENLILEVKSSKIKTGVVVGIHSSYQLSTEKPTKLSFIRLEQKPYAAYSINILKDKLVKKGFSEDDIEKNLEESGYKIGNRSRDITFDLLSFYLFDVNKNNFPVFNLEDINKITNSNNIIGFELNVDLSNTEKTIIFEKEININRK